MGFRDNDISLITSDRKKLCRGKDYAVIKSSFLEFAMGDCTNKFGKNIKGMSASPTKPSAAPKVQARAAVVPVQGLAPIAEQAEAEEHSHFVVDDLSEDEQVPFELWGRYSESSDGHGSVAGMRGPHIPAQQQGGRKRSSQ